MVNRHGAAGSPVAGKYARATGTLSPVRKFAFAVFTALILVTVVPNVAEAPKEALPRLVSARDNGPILRLYLATLDRLPDRAGLQYWTDIHDEGTDPDTIANLFMTSPEFVGRFGEPDDETFVRLVYNNVLGRSPDDRGLYYWTDLLSDEYSRSVIVTGFANSAEFVSSTERLLQEQPESMKVLMIGDSIFHGIGLLGLPMADVEPTWMTEEGRHPSALPGLITEADRIGTLAEADAVVIHLGTNSWNSDYVTMVNAQLALLAEKRVVLVNVAASRSWESAANTDLAAIANSSNNVTLVDWHASVGAQPDLLRPDGVHPTTQGLQQLADLVALTLYSP